jgi:methylmalonyl-CoA mutase N-terminal domain/subunit
MCEEIRRAAVENQQDFDSGRKKLVGVNTLVVEDDIQMRALEILDEHADFDALFEYSPALAEKQIARLNKVRAERDHEALRIKKHALREAMEAGENMIPPLMEAVKSGLTRGEFGEIKADVYRLPGEGPYVCSPPHVLA